MSDNKWIEQDWEHEFQKDEIYSIERQKDIERSWQEWEEKKPAIIKVLTQIKKKDEQHNTLPF